VFRGFQGARRRRALAAAVTALGITAAVAGAQLASAATTPTAAPRAAAAKAAPAKPAARTVDRTIAVKGTFDGAGKRFVGGGALGDGGQSEDQDAMFELADGATLSNVTLGFPAADGVHCKGSCTLRNITWEDVGEDAATFTGTNATVVVDGGSAAKGDDKVFQDNRQAGGSVTIRNFAVSDFGKLYRSCGNCRKQAARTVTITNVTATAPGKVLAGVNANLGDRVTLSKITITGPKASSVKVCELFGGNNTGKEPTKVGSAPDGRTCVASGITVR
jgi:hypothetical protein